MPITITRDQLTDMNPCDLDARLALFGKRKSLNVAQALKAGATTRDILWVAGRLGLCDQLVTFARGCAAADADADADADYAYAAADADYAYAAAAAAYADADAAYADCAAAAAYAAAAAAADADYAYAAADADYAYAAAAAAAAARRAEIARQHAHLIELF